MDELLKYLLGAGGLTAITVALLGYLRGKPASDAHPQEPSQALTFAALLADKEAANRILALREKHIDAINRQTDAIMENTAAMRERARVTRAGH